MDSSAKQLKATTGGMIRDHGTRRRAGPQSSRSGKRGYRRRAKHQKKINSDGAD